MANPEHVAVVRAGADAIRQWRVQHPTEMLDLSFERLGITEKPANIHTVLASALSPSSDLLEASYSAGTTQSGAAIVRSDLRGADLSGAMLRWTDLSFANLKGARFDRAVAGRTLFCGTDLSEALGLDTIRHEQPSQVDLHTILKSRCRIPDTFLLGCAIDPRIQAALCGTPEQRIGVINDWIAEGRPPCLQTCFISYATEDKAFVDRLVKELDGRDPQSMWYAHGRWLEPIKPQVEREIGRRDRTVFVVSEVSITKDWFLYELDPEQAQGRLFW